MRFTGCVPASLGHSACAPVGPAAHGLWRGSRGQGRRIRSLPVTRRGLALGVSSAVSLGTLAGVLAIGGVAAAAAAAAAAGNRQDPRDLVRAGMLKFRQNDVEGSLEDFDAALAAAPSIRPQLWQRGLSLYYLSRYEDGAKQFRDDVAFNPNDTEESIWAFLCEAQMMGPAKARQIFLQVGLDPRPVMRAAVRCFQEGSDPAAILAAAAGDSRGGHDSFYANLYVGLWQEAEGDAESARQAITRAVATPYAQMSGDYMASLARVHCLRRGWPLP